MNSPKPLPTSFRCLVAVFGMAWITAFALGQFKINDYLAWGVFALCMVLAFTAGWGLPALAKALSNWKIKP